MPCWREAELLGALDQLVTTPRQAKRLFNLYRMVRATRDLSEVSDFLGTADEPGQYQAVAVLLGIVTGYAREFGPLIEAPPEPGRGGGLLHRPPGMGRLEFVEDLRLTESGDGWSNGIVGPLAGSERGRWSALYEGVRGLAVRPGDLADLQLWAPRIRRFSYVLTEQ